MRPTVEKADVEPLSRRYAAWVIVGGERIEARDEKPRDALEGLVDVLSDRLAEARAELAP